MATCLTLQRDCTSPFDWVVTHQMAIFADACNGQRAGNTDESWPIGMTSTRRSSR
jgi:hypothetical protein